MAMWVNKPSNWRFNGSVKTGHGCAISMARVGALRAPGPLTSNIRDQSY